MRKKEIKKKILIIGSQGYLGSRLGNYLTAKNYICSGIDTGFFKNGIILDEINFSTINMDVRKIKKRNIEKYDAVIMLAGISNDPFGELKPEKIYDPTRKYTLKIANICKKIGIKFIFSSSCSVYGIASGYFDENETVNPRTPYSLNKYQIETDLKKISGSNFSPIVLRLATIFGISPRIRFDVIINMICGLAVTQNKIILNSNGQAWRPHLHIEDACEAFRCCIDKEFKKDEMILLNVGRNDNNMKIIDVANLVLKYSNKCELEFNFKNNGKNSYIQDRKIQDGVDKRTYKVNFNKINKILPNFKCKWSVQKGIKDFLDVLKKIKLTKIKFNKRDFYRLQQIEYLLTSKQINKNLYWK